MVNHVQISATLGLDPYSYQTTRADPTRTYSIENVILARTCSVTTVKNALMAPNAPKRFRHTLSISRIEVLKLVLRRYATVMPATSSAKAAWNASRIMD